MGNAYISVEEDTRYRWKCSQCGFSSTWLSSRREAESYAINHACSRSGKIIYE